MKNTFYLIQIIFLCDYLCEKKSQNLDFSFLTNNLSQEFPILYYQKD